MPKGSKACIKEGISLAPLVIEWEVYSKAAEGVGGRAEEVTPNPADVYQNCMQFFFTSIRC